MTILSLLRSKAAVGERMTPQNAIALGISSRRRSSAAGSRITESM